jgi:hypothetical protein
MEFRWNVFRNTQIHVRYQRNAKLGDFFSQWVAIKIPFFRNIVCTDCYMGDTVSEELSVSIFKAAHEGRYKNTAMPKDSYKIGLGLCLTIKGRLLLLLLNLFSLLITRWRSSCKSRSQQEIRAIYPSTERMMCSLAWPSVVLWPTDGLGTTEGSDLTLLNCS